MGVAPLVLSLLGVSSVLRLPRGSRRTSVRETWVDEAPPWPVEEELLAQLESGTTSGRWAEGGPTAAVQSTGYWGHSIGRGGAGGGGGGGGLFHQIYI